LIVWQDEGPTFKGRRIICLGDIKAAPNQLGQIERLRHIDSIHNGAHYLLAIARVVDTKALPRKIAAIDHDSRTMGGLFERNGYWWTEYREPGSSSIGMTCCKVVENSYQKDAGSQPWPRTLFEAAARRRQSIAR